MKINAANILNTIKPIAKKGLQVTNEIGSTTRNFVKSGFAYADSFIKSKEGCSNLFNSAKKAGVNKDTAVGLAVAFGSIILASKAIINSKNKIQEIRNKNK